jgi:GNAT superfamily N-acetyltransferase
LGIFCTATPDSNIPAETLKTGRLVESGRQNGAIAVLLAHIVATMSLDSVVTDNAMNFPHGWDSERPPAVTTGHQEGGRTICVHSLGVLPEFQGRGLGRILMTAYIQQMSGAGIADRIAIIAHEVRFHC